PSSPARPANSPATGAVPRGTAPPPFAMRERSTTDMTQAIKITISALIVVLFAFSLLFVGIRALGMASFVVTGGSMEPTIHKGSLVIDLPVTADTLRLGDIITFDHYDQTTTHRIVGLEGTANGTLFSDR